MLYIISGVPRSGKSILSKKLFTAKNISYFPIDALTSCLEESVPEIAILHKQSHAKEFEKISGHIGLYRTWNNLFQVFCV